MKKISIKEVQSLELEVMKKFHDFCVGNGLKYYMIAGSMLGAVRHSGFIPWDDDIDVGMLRSHYEKFLEITKNFPEPYEVCNYRKNENCDYVLTRIYIPNTKIDNKAIAKTTLDQRLYFDVFPIDNVPDNVEQQKQQDKELQKMKKKIAYFYVHDNIGNSRVDIFVKKIISIFLKPFRKKILKNMDNVMKRYENIETEFLCSMSSQYSYEKQKILRTVYGEPTLIKFCNEEFYGVEFPDEYLKHLYGENYMEIPSVEKRRMGHDVYVEEIKND